MTDKTVPVTTKPRRIRKPQTASTVQVRPNFAELSFVKGRMGPNGWVTTDYFAVPDEDWFAGRVTGVLAFQELQRWVKAEGTERARFRAQWMVEDAFKAMNSGTPNGPSKRGAAGKFVECVFQFFMAAVMNERGDWVAGQVDHSRAFLVDHHARAARERAEFVERMQAARAAKRAARTLASTGQHPEKTSFSEAGEGVAA